MKLIVYALLAVVAVVIVSIAIGAWKWEQATRALIDEMRGGDRPAPPPRSMESLPEPVARYFDNVFTGEPPAARYARLTQIGEFAMPAGWRPFQATQHVDLTRPGFVWDARIDMAPLVPVRVRDAYVRGRGSMRAKISSVVTVMDARDEPELASGALLRYLAEAAWFPIALLPSPALRWHAVDAASAQATLSDGGLEVAATFHFDDAGDITAVSAKRYREVEGEYVLTPWRGRFWNHAVREAGRIPLNGEVSWMLPEGESPYWRGEIVEIALDP
jgi:hypothetical protein